MPITAANQVLLGLGLATLSPTNGTAVIQVANVPRRSDPGWVGTDDASWVTERMQVMPPTLGLCTTSSCELADPLCP